MIADRGTIYGNAGVTLFPDVGGHNLTSYNLGASAIFAANNDLNFLLEAVANWDEELAAGGGTDHRTSAVIWPGLRYALNLPGDTQVVLGVAIPIELARDAPDYGVFLYLSVEHPFAR